MLYTYYSKHYLGSVNSPIIAESGPFLLQVQYRLLYSHDYIMHW